MTISKAWRYNWQLFITCLPVQHDLLWFIQSWKQIVGAFAPTDDLEISTQTTTIETFTFLHIFRPRFDLISWAAQLLFRSARVSFEGWSHPYCYSPCLPNDTSKDPELDKQPGVGPFRSNLNIQPINKINYGLQSIANSVGNHLHTCLIHFECTDAISKMTPTKNQIPKKILCQGQGKTCTLQNSQTSHSHNCLT